MENTKTTFNMHFENMENLLEISNSSKNKFCESLAAANKESNNKIWITWNHSLLSSKQVRVHQEWTLDEDYK